MTTNDAQLAASCRAGDTSAFGALYDAYVRKIYDFVYYRTHHRETAEDLTSQTFTKALERIGGFDAEKGTFSAWLYRIARNTVIDHYRGSRPTLDIEDVWDALRDKADIARDAEVRERLSSVEKHLAALKPEQRDIVLMRLWDGLSYAEIAEITGKSEAACKMSCSRTLMALRKAAPLAALLLLLSNPIHH